MPIDPTKPADNALVSTLPAYIREARAEVSSVVAWENEYTDEVMAAHIADTDPHTQYVEPGDLGSAAFEDSSAFDSSGTASSLVAALSDVYEPKNANIQSHLGSTSNPHSVTAEQVGLGNVTNESKATLFTNPTFTGAATIPGGTPIATTSGNSLNTPLAGGFYSVSAGTDSTLDSTVVAIAKATATSASTHINYAGWFEAQNEAVAHTQGSLSGVFLAAVNNNVSGATPNIIRSLIGQAIHRGTSTVSSLIGGGFFSSTTTTDYLGNTITPGAITTQYGFTTTATNAGGASITTQYGVNVTASNANSTSTAAGQQGAIVNQRGINLSVTTGAASKAGYVGLQDGIFLTYGTSTSSGCTAIVNSGRGIYLIPSLLAGATINYLEGIRYASPSAGTVLDERAIVIAGATMLGTDSYSFYSQPSNGKFYNAGEATFGSTVTSTQYKLSALNTAPSSATATGTAGEIRVTSDAIYVCTATDTWVKAALATW